MMIPIDGNNDIDKKVVRRLKKIALIYMKDRPASGHLWFEKRTCRVSCVPWSTLRKAGCVKSCNWTQKIQMPT